MKTKEKRAGILEKSGAPHTDMKNQKQNNLNPNTPNFQPQMLNNKNNRNNDRQIFTDREAAEYLRIGQTTLWRLRKEGRIAYRRSSAKLVYTRADLDEYLEGTKRDAFAAN